MKQYAKSYELKNKAKDKLGGKYGSAILVTFLGMLIPGAVRMFVNLLFSPFMPSVTAIGNPSSLIPSYIFAILLSLVLSIVLGIFDVGITLFFLNMSCGQPYSVRDLFYGFRNDWRKALTLSGIVAFISAVCLFPYQYMMDYFLLTRQETWLYGAAIAMVIGYCIYIPVTLNLSLVYYLMLDFPDKGAGEILKLSIQFMRGHKKRLFYIQMSFIPLMLLCVCTLYIGFLWLMPYMYMTETCFFLDIMNPKETET